MRRQLWLLLLPKSANEKDASSRPFIETTSERAAITGRVQQFLPVFFLSSLLPCAKEAC